MRPVIQPCARYTICRMLVVASEKLNSIRVKRSTFMSGDQEHTDALALVLVLCLPFVDDAMLSA